MIQKNFFSETSYFNSLRQSWEVIEKLHEETSKYQKIEVFNTKPLGKLLTLDGKTMVSELDEFVYHECMGHIPMAIARDPRKILIIGGGDGGVVREFTKHKYLTQIDLVEIDERVVEVSKIYFPECTVGLTDPRVKVLPEDGISFVKNLPAKTYDVVIVDSTDPEQFAEGLFTKEFYGDIFNALTDDGIMMAQTENPFLDEFGIGNIYQNLRNSFPIVESFSAPMIIYPGVYWSFAFASKKYRGTDFNEHYMNDMNKLSKNLKWYNLDWHRGSFALSNLHKKVIGEKLQ